MAAKLTRLAHKIETQLHLMAESWTIRSSRSRWPSGNVWIHPRKSNLSCVLVNFYGLDDRGFGSREELDFFLLSTESRPAWGPPSPISNEYRGFFQPGIRRLGRETNPSPPSSSEVKNVCWVLPPFPNTSSWRGA
jgi:hypothetical protein